MKVLSYLLVVFALVSALVTTTSANDLTSSQSAIETWKQLVTTKLHGETSFRYTAIGVSVGKSDGTSITVNVTPAVSVDVKEIRALSIMVQPVEVMSSNSGTILKIVGNPSKVASGAFERDATDGEYLGNRQMTVALSPGVNALKISVFGLGSNAAKPYTIIVPITKDGLSTALGQVTATSASQMMFGKGQWFIGYCPGTCEVQCVGCDDNSPVLNCVNGTM
jgi:hypothetical protein